MAIVLTALFSLVPPLLILTTAFLWIDPVHWRRYLPMYTLIFALLAYSYVPGTNSDLVRYFEMLDNYKMVSLREAFENTSSSLYVMVFLMWAISKTGCYGLMPMLTTGTVYGVSAYITCDFAEQKGQCKMIPALMLMQFFFLPLINIINNVRNVLAFSLVVLAVYRDIIKRRRNLMTIVLYVIPIFMHTSGIILVLLRFASPYVKRFKELFLAGVFFISGLISFAMNHISLFAWSNLLTRVIQKSSGYASDEYLDTEWGARVANSLYYRLYYLTAMIFALLVILLYFRFLKYPGTAEINTAERTVAAGTARRHGKKRENAVRRARACETIFFGYVFLIAITVLGCSVFNAPHYWRFAVALTLPLGAIIILVRERYGKREAMICKCLCAVSVVYLMMNLYRFLRAAEIREWMEYFLLNNPYRIISEVVRNILP